MHRRKRHPTQPRGMDTSDQLKEFENPWDRASRERVRPDWSYRAPPLGANQPSRYNFVRAPWHVPCESHRILSLPWLALHPEGRWMTLTDAG